MLISLGENWFWSLLGLKGVNAVRQTLFTEAHKQILAGAYGLLILVITPCSFHETNIKLTSSGSFTDLNISWRRKVQHHFAAFKEIQQSLGLWIPSCGFRILNPRIPDSTSKNFLVVIDETYNVQHCRHIFNVGEILGGCENAVISYVLTALPC